MDGGAAILMLISWAIGLCLLILVIAADVRLGMRWSRADERKEQTAQEKLGTEKPNPPDFKPFRTGRNFK